MLDNSPPTLWFAPGMDAGVVQRDAASRPIALLIGASDRPEFCEASRRLREMTTLLSVPTIEAALAQLTGGGVVPDFVVVAQSRPGEFSPAQIDSLRRQASLTRIVGLLGPWCEGETRTGRPWPGAVRIYWYHWLPQCSRAVGKLLDGACPSWGMPVTATDEERLLALSVEKLPTRQGLIAVAAWHAETADALADACRACGYQTLWLRPDRLERLSAPLSEAAAEAPAQIMAALWVGGDLNDREAGELQQLSAQLPGVPIIALLDFPRIATSARARACGAAAVMARPFQLEDLFWQLDQVLGFPQESSRPNSNLNNNLNASAAA